MVDVWNPTPASSTQTTNVGPGGGGSVDKLKHLELHECAVLGLDVMEWMKSRVLEVVCVELAYDRWVPCCSSDSAATKSILSWDGFDIARRKPPRSPSYPYF
jgi:hypothetical protein